MCAVRGGCEGIFWSLGGLLGRPEAEKRIFGPRNTILDQFEKIDFWVKCGEFCVFEGPKPLLLAEGAPTLYVL